MDWKRHLFEAATLVGAAILCALVANALAGRERKLALPGSYDSALSVPGPAAGVRTAPSPAPAPADAPTPSPILAAVPPPAAVPAPRPGAPTTSPAADPAPTRAADPAAAIRARFPAHDTPWLEISGDDVAWLHARGTLVLDARRTKDFEAGHVAGARSLAVWEADALEKVKALADEGRDPKVPVVVYCSGGDCEDSHMLAEKLFGAGFSNVLVYRDGFPDWQRRNGPSRRGLDP